MKKIETTPSGRYLTEWKFTYSRFLGLEAPFPLALMGLSISAYLVLVYVIGPATRPSTESSAKRYKALRGAHNVALSLFSAICFVLSLGRVVYMNELRNFEALACTNDAPNWLLLANDAFIASKVWEWLDSLWLVWGAKDLRKLSFLHVYHHATTLWLFLLVSNFPSCVKMGMCLNGFVHTLMYAHYARPFPKPLILAITFAQILQLMAVAYLWHYTPSTCDGRFAEFAYRDYTWEYWTPHLFVPVYLFFFVRYFVRRYVVGATRAVDKRRKSSPATIDPIPSH
jgi:hypothetical protein